MDKRQFRQFIVRPTLAFLYPAIPFAPGGVAEELLMFTWAHESEGGMYLAQVGGGPALGVFGMEPTTHDDLWFNFLPNRLSLKDKLSEISRHCTPFELTYNLRYAAAMCRVQYFRATAPLPSSKDAQTLSEYWGAYYQTQSDPLKMAEARSDYVRYVK